MTSSSSINAFDVLVDRCEADFDCRQAFPDIHGDLDAVLGVLDHGPVTLPRYLQEQPLVATRDAFGPWLHYQLMGTYRAADVPRSLHRAATDDDWEPLASSWLDREHEMLAADPVPLMNWTIGCHEPWARQRSVTTMAWATESFLTYGNIQQLGWRDDFCAMVPEPDPAAIYDPPTASPIPVLIVNTDGDAQNPPENVSHADRYYPASRVLVAPGLSHQEWTPEFVACLATMIDSFVQTATADAVDATCLDSVSAPPITLEP